MTAIVVLKTRERSLLWMAASDFAFSLGTMHEDAYEDT